VTAQPVVVPRGAATRARVVSRATATRLALVALMLATVAWRLLAALGRPTPTYMPDEFLYSELARSLATEGQPLLRDQPISFPALLDPLLTAPLWLLGGVETGFRAAQVLHVLAFSLAAVPAYLVCRTLRLDRAVALAAAAFTLAQPAGIFAGWVTADAVGLTVALFALWAALRVLERPTLGGQALAFTLAAAAAFARLQYVALLAVVPIGALVLDGRRPRHALRRWWPTFSLVLATAGATLAVGLDRVLGIYRGVGALDRRSGDLVDALQTQLTGLSYAWSAVLLPGAAVGVLLALLRPRHRAERAFALVVLVAGLGLLAESTLLAAGVGPGRFMERYVIVLAPLLVPAFALSLGRGRVAVWTSVGGAAALVALTARVPVSALVAGDLPSDSPAMRGVLELQAHVGVAGAAAAMSAAVATLAAVGAAAVLRPALRPIALACAVAGTLALAVLASTLDRSASRHAADALPPDPSWIDGAGLDDVALLMTPGTTANAAYQQLFWNRSVRDILRMPGAPPIDQGTSTDVTVRDDGTLLAGGRPLTAPLAVVTSGATVRLAGVARVAGTATSMLVRPAGRPRLELLADRSHDGWLAAHGNVRVWQPDERVRGVVVLSLQGRGGEAVDTLKVSAPGYRRTITLRGSQTRELRVPAVGVGRWQLEYEAGRGRLADGRVTSIRAPKPPRFVPSSR
jgi:hypothetical protein